MIPPAENYPPVRLQLLVLDHIQTKGFQILTSSLEQPPPHGQSTVTANLDVIYNEMQDQEFVQGSSTGAGPVLLGHVNLCTVLLHLLKHNNLLKGLLLLVSCLFFWATLIYVLHLHLLRTNSHTS